MSDSTPESTRSRTIPLTCSRSTGVTVSPRAPRRSIASRVSRRHGGSGPWGRAGAHVCHIHVAQLVQRLGRLAGDRVHRIQQKPNAVRGRARQIGRDVDVVFRIPCEGDTEGRRRNRDDRSAEAVSGAWQQSRDGCGVPPRRRRVQQCRRGGHHHRRRSSEHSRDLRTGRVEARGDGRVERHLRAGQVRRGAVRIELAWPLVVGAGGETECDQH